MTKSSSNAVHLESPEYRVFHRAVVAECVRLMGDEALVFFDQQCDYLEEFERGDIPEDVARAQYEALA